MPIQARSAFEYAARVLSENPDDPRLVENRLDWLNSAKDRIAEWGKWRFLEAWGKLTTPTSGVFYFPDHVWEVLTFFPSALGYRRPVDFIGGAQFDGAGPSITAGLADYAIPWGYYGVHADAPAAAQVSFDIAPDPTEAGVQVVVEGLDASGNVQIETVTLNAAGVGTTSGTFAAGVDGVRRIYVIPTTLFEDDGSVRSSGILTATMSGTSMERLNLAREVRHEHLRVELYPGNGNTEFTFRYYKRVPDIISINHVLEIPHEYKDIYTDLLKGHILEFTEGAMAAAPYFGAAQARMNSLKRREERQPGRRRGLRPTRRYRRMWRW